MTTQWERKNLVCVFPMVKSGSSKLKEVFSMSTEQFPLVCGGVTAKEKQVNILRESTKMAQTAMHAMAILFAVLFH